MEQLLYPVLELVGLFLAQILKPGPVVPELRVGHGSFEQIVVEPVELEREEQELGGDGGDLLLNVAEEFLPRRIRRVGGVEQARIRHDAPHAVAQCLVLAHGLGERLAALSAVGERRELAGIGLMHRVGGALRGLQIGLERRRIRALIEIGEVPLRQRPEFLLAARLSACGLAASSCRAPRRPWRAPPAMKAISAALEF